jgi:xeroderma pigmentosum group C-complementing protein
MWVRRRYAERFVLTIEQIDDLEDPVDFDDFKGAAKALSGSRDLGAQLFCALLRSVAVDTRLVCSLQPLPFSGVAKGMTPEKPMPQYIYSSNITHQAPQQDHSITETIATPSNARWRASEHASEEYIASPLPTTRPSPNKRIKDSPYPVFWTEVFSPSIDKWIPVDPLVRHTFNKPRTSFEPPASDRLNSMSYVIAFEDDASARDVTRRYARQYNAKTRKLRVESTKGGDKWWKRTMAFFERPFPETRDEIENNELAAREAQEGMPKNVGDFKGHPIFALERHLRRSEVIHPMREAGKISAGTGGKAESVYRRKDVHVVRSADQWYRKGRDVRGGEQPLKRAVTRRSDRTTPMDEYYVAEDGVGLYAEFQTDVYVPPPVVDGRVPRNAYGNLDVYVPSMIPAGAIHVQHPLAARSAKVLGVDYADAVTGFDFKGRQGTAVVNGIVVAAEYREAFVETIKTMEHEQAQAEQSKQTHLALQMWRRFMTALRIKEKIDKEYADDSSNEDMNDRAYEAPGSEEDIGGGFVPEAGVKELDDDRAEPQMAVPLHFVSSEIVVIESPHKLENDKLQTNSLDAVHIDSTFDESDIQEYGGGFIPEQAADEEAGGFIPEQEAAEEDCGSIPDEGLDNLKVPRAERRDIDHNGDFMLSAVDLGRGVKSPTAILPTTVAPFNPSGTTMSPLAAAPTADGNSRAEGLEVPPSLAREESTASIKQITSSRSSDSIDNESLLSHDPEDEDAEPEWLMDDEEL